MEIEINSNDHKISNNKLRYYFNNENSTFKNISYKSVNRTKLNNTNNNSFPNNRIRFNTKELSNHLVSYEDAYILLEVDIKFSEAANALPANIRLKNTYEMVNSIMIELNKRADDDIHRNIESFS